MSIKRWTRHLALAAATGLAATACASNPQPAATSQGAATIVVDNASGPSTGVTAASVYLLPRNGTRDLLGTVTMDSQKSFVVKPDVSLEYQLVATEGTQSIRSRTFTMTPGDAIEWDLSLNTIKITQSR